MSCGRDEHRSKRQAFIQRMKELETWLNDAKIAHDDQLTVTGDNVHSRQQLADLQVYHYNCLNEAY